MTILAIGADAIVAAGVADPDWLAEQGSRWFAATTYDPPPSRHLSGVTEVAGYALRHASVRSVWFINSLRAALAIAAAVAVADLSSVQHGFWVVLGTLVGAADQCCVDRRHSRARARRDTRRVCDRRGDASC